MSLPRIRLLLVSGDGVTVALTSTSLLVAEENSDLCESTDTLFLLIHPSLRDTGKTEVHVWCRTGTPYVRVADWVFEKPWVKYVELFIGQMKKGLEVEKIKQAIRALVLELNTISS